MQCCNLIEIRIPTKPHQKSSKTASPRTLTPPSKSVRGGWHHVAAEWWRFVCWQTVNWSAVCSLNPLAENTIWKNMAMKFASLMPPTKLPDMHFLFSFVHQNWCQLLCCWVICHTARDQAGNYWSTWCVSWVEPIMVAKIFQDWLQWSWNKSNQRRF